MFDNILNTTANAISISQILICVATALICGLIISFVYQKCNDIKSQSFAITLVLLPILVSLVIMMVNGNLGTGVAIAGAFALIRFRSVPANAKDICIIFFAMVIGLVIGAGYIGYAVLFTVIINAIYYVLCLLSFGSKNNNVRILKVTIPEDLDYANAFDDVIQKYTIKSQLAKTKTVNLGALYKLTYNVILKKDIKEKDFLDELRVRNGNLTVMLLTAEADKKEQL